jgi:hypothetical protein
VKAWLTIWTSPRITVRKLADAGDEEKGLVLAALVGALYGYQQFTLGKPLFEPDLLSLRKFWPAVAATSGFAGAVVNLVFVYVGGGVFPWVGRFFGARSASNEVRTALCWSQAPLLALGAVVFVLNLPLNILYGDPRSPGFGPHLDAWISQWPGLTPTIVFIALIGFSIVAVLWFVVVFVASVAEVLNLGLWRALGTIVLAFPLSSVLASLLAILFMRLS